MGSIWELGQQQPYLGDMTYMTDNDEIEDLYGKL